MAALPPSDDEPTINYATWFAEEDRDATHNILSFLQPQNIRQARVAIPGIAASTSEGNSADDAKGPFHPVHSYRLSPSTILRVGASRSLKVADLCFKWSTNAMLLAMRQRALTYGQNIREITLVAIDWSWRSHLDWNPCFPNCQVLTIDSMPASALRGMELPQTCREFHCTILNYGVFRRPQLPPDVTDAMVLPPSLELIDISIHPEYVSYEENPVEGSIFVGLSSLVENEAKFNGVEVVDLFPSLGDRSAVRFPNLHTVSLMAFCFVDFVSFPVAFFPALHSVFVPNHFRPVPVRPQLTGLLDDVRYNWNVLSPTALKTLRAVDNSRLGKHELTNLETLIIHDRYYGPRYLPKLKHVVLIGEKSHLILSDDTFWARNTVTKLTLRGSNNCFVSNRALPIPNSVTDLEVHSFGIPVIRRASVIPLVSVKIVIHSDLSHMRRFTMDGARYFVNVPLAENVMVEYGDVGTLVLMLRLDMGVLQRAVVTMRSDVPLIIDSEEQAPVEAYRPLVERVSLEQFDRRLFSKDDTSVREPNVDPFEIQLAFSKRPSRQNLWRSQWALFYDILCTQLQGGEQHLWSQLNPHFILRRHQEPTTSIQYSQRFIYDQFWSLVRLYFPEREPHDVARLGLGQETDSAVLGAFLFVLLTSLEHTSSQPFRSVVHSSIGTHFHMDTREWVDLWNQLMYDHPGQIDPVRTAPLLVERWWQEHLAPILVAPVIPRIRTRWFQARPSAAESQIAHVLKKKKINVASSKRTHQTSNRSCQTHGRDINDQRATSSKAIVVPLNLASKCSGVDG